MNHDPLQIKTINIDATRMEWSILRIIFPKKIAVNTEEFQIERGDIVLLKNQLRNLDPSSKLVAEQLIVLVESENALVIHFKKEPLPADTPPANIP